MQVEDQQLKLFLLDFGLVSKKDVDISLKEAQKKSKKLEEIILGLVLFVLAGLITAFCLIKIGHFKK